MKILLIECCLRMRVKMEGGVGGGGTERFKTKKIAIAGKLVGMNYLTK